MSTLPTAGPTSADGSTSLTSDGPGTGTADESSGSDTSAEGSVLESLVGALCDWEFRCCSRGELDYRLGPFTDDTDECTARYVQELNSNNNETPVIIGSLLDDLGFSVRLDRVEINTAQVEACIALIDERACNELIGEGEHCTPSDGENPCALDRLFTGRQGLGQDCNAALSIDIECAPGGKCISVAGDLGECQARATEGQFCSSSDDCDDGLYCDLAEGTCAPKGDVDDPCEFEDPLAPDPGTETRECLSHLTCDPVGEACVASCTLGYACTSDSECPDTLSCVPLEPGSSYRYCSDPGDAGSACDSDEDCSSGNYCNGDNCSLSTSIGNECSTHEECVTGYCAITCQNYEGPGDACTFPEQCNPSTTVGCFTSEDGQLCRANKLSNGSICNAIEDSCASGICDATATGYRCIDGEAENEDCDDNPATTSTNLCGAGLYCDADDGQCKAQSGAGGTCADDDDVQCLNGACDEGGPWGADVCTDAPENAESVTCDGE